MTRRPAPFHTVSGVRRSPLSVLAAIGAIGAALALPACGGSSSNNAAENERSSEAKAEAKFADFARCLREHGINAETATMPGGGHGLKIGPRPGAPRTESAGPGRFEAAQKACARYRPEEKKVNLSPQERVQREEAVQKFAKCMREHGIKVEASTNGGGFSIQIHGHPGETGAPNPESPAFQSAQQSCQKFLPFRGGGPKGAPRGPGAGGAAKDGGGFGLQTGG